MANRIVGHVIIVDSAMGNAQLLTSANMVVQLSTLYISAIGLFGIDTTAAITLTEVNTATNEVFKTAFITQGAGTGFQPSLQLFNFSTPWRVTNLKVPLLTAATGFIYLK